ncbi:NAD(P)-linked oxidoreductase superfamily protein [Rhynchospora pubera]|uniref:NAD(P)-linked oxidoreductase superfamily protein n=1 Tax=Rhynchospora pubera TaxID=906938 RepID=A0AAV8GIR4_9POAL|nr:NAD(P)-linked oxidoreductase superfamily protein [Rhynchospora pubera]
MSVPLFQLASDLSVSRLCFGTMTFGEQNTFPETLSLLNEAYRAGINFFDSAEMYPVPQRRDTHGRSEEYLGRWIKDQKIPRNRVILATKVAGPSGQMTWIRGGPNSLDSKNISAAIDSSLLRLSTDYIDLYQIHWPDRYVPMFGETEYDPTKQYSSVPMEEQLDALQKAIENGKIRYIGLSNETPYGLMKFLHLSRNSSLSPKILTIQNAYNLLCRNFDSGLAECCHHERISLLAYSPMAMGILSGKYFSSGGTPPDARLNIFRGRYSEGESRYKLSDPVVKAAVLEYVRIAKNYGISPASLAIGTFSSYITLLPFVLNHPIIASVVFGATKLWQLQEVIEVIDIHLATDIILEINEVHARFPNPCP